MGREGWELVLLLLGVLVLDTYGFALATGRGTGRATWGMSVERVGFSFTPGGLLFPYHLGVAKALQEGRFLTDCTPIAGSSAGALTCAVLGCDLDLQDMVSVSSELCQDCREGGTRYRLRDVVHSSLDKFLPEDAHHRINNRRGEVSIAITHLNPLPRGEFVSSFHSRHDLIEVLLGSCCVPWWFARTPTLRVRGKPTMDGVFAVPRKQFGAPDITTCEQVVRVSVFPHSTWPMESKVAGDLISPDLLGGHLKYRFLELLNYALNPAPDDKLEELFTMGWKTGHLWMAQFGQHYQGSNTQDPVGRANPLIESAVA